MLMPHQDLILANQMRRVFGGVLKFEKQHSRLQQTYEKLFDN